MEYEILISELERVSGIRTTLETRDNIIGRSENIHNLAFSLVAPLEPENHIYFLHKRIIYISSTGV